MPGKRRGWGKGHRSTSRIGRLHKRKGNLRKEKKGDADDEVNEEDEISWEVLLKSFLDNSDLEEVTVTTPPQNSFCATLKQ